MQAIGWKAGAFVKLYNANRDRSVNVAIDNSAVGASILSFVKKNPSGISGLYTDVSAKLKTHHAQVCGDAFRSKDWPSGNSEFGGMLRRLTPAIESKGIIVELRRQNQGFTCRIMTSHPRA